MIVFWHLKLGQDEKLRPYLRVQIGNPKDPIR